MDFMYCIPDLDAFIDNTIKRCLLEYDLEADDTEFVLNDIEKVMTRPAEGEEEEEGGCHKTIQDGGHHVAQKSSRRHVRRRDGNTRKDLTSVLGTVHDLQKRETMDKAKSLGKDDAFGWPVKDKPKTLTSNYAPVLDLSKKKSVSAAQPPQNCLEDQENSSGYPSSESKSPSPDIMNSSSNLTPKMKYRLQQRYLHDSREPSPEKMQDEEDQKPVGLRSPDSGLAPSEGSVYDESFSPSPISLNPRKRSSSGYESDEQTGSEAASPRSHGDHFGSSPPQNCQTAGQPRTKLIRLLDHLDSSATCQRRPRNQSQKEEVVVDSPAQKRATSEQPRIKFHNGMEWATPASSTAGASNSSNNNNNTRLAHHFQRRASESSSLCSSTADNPGPFVQVQTFQASEPPRTGNPFLIEYSTTPPNPTACQRRVHHTQREESESLCPESKIEHSVSHAQKHFAPGQSRPKITHLIPYPSSPVQSTCLKRPMQTTEKERHLPNFHRLAFRSSPNENTIDTLPVQTQQCHTELRGQYRIAGATTTNGHPVSTPTCDVPQPYQNHLVVAQSKTINKRNQQRCLLLKQMLQQEQHQGQKLGSSFPAASQHPHYQQELLLKRQQGTNGFHREPSLVDDFPDQTSFISNIIVKELMQAEDNALPKSTPTLVSGGSSLNVHPTRIRASQAGALKLHAPLAESQTVQSSAPTSATPPSQGLPPVTLASWHSSPPPVVQNTALETSPRQPVPLRAHERPVNVSRVCVVPDSSIFLNVLSSSTSDQYHDHDVPQDLSQKSSRRLYNNNNTSSSLLAKV